MSACAVLFLQTILEDGVDAIAFEKSSVIDYEQLAKTPLRGRLRLLDSSLRGGFFDDPAKSSVYYQLDRLVTLRNQIIAHTKPKLRFTMRSSDGETTVTNATSRRDVTSKSLLCLVKAQWWGRLSFEDARGFESAVVSFLTTFIPNILRPEHPREDDEKWDPSKPSGSA